MVLNGRAVPVFATATRGTGSGTVAGLPMVSLPAGTTGAGPPAGMRLEGRPFDDARLLATASAVRAAFGDLPEGRAPVAPSPPPATPER